MSSTSYTRRAAGYCPECLSCQRARRLGKDACQRHWVPEHIRFGDRDCPKCGGAKEPEDAVCGRCRAAGE